MEIIRFYCVSVRKKGVQQKEREVVAQKQSGGTPHLLLPL